MSNTNDLMTIQAQLAAAKQQCEALLPQEAWVVITQAVEDLLREEIAHRSLQTGAHIPSFCLPNQENLDIASTTLLTQGPLVISFLRGEWCPFCQIELAGLDTVLPIIYELGANAVAITPQVRQWRRNEQTTNRAISLNTDILRDRGNQVARQFGLSFSVSSELRSVYQHLGFSLTRFNGGDNLELPIPATYVVNPAGEIIYSFVNPDHTKRPDPVEIITQLRRIQTL